MPDERTPLLTVVHIAPQRQRYPHQTLRRVCTFVLSIVLVISVTIFLLLLLVVPDCRDNGHHRSSSPCIRNKNPFYRHHSLASKDDGLKYEELLDVLASTPDEEKAKEWSRYYTSGPHLAGKNLSQAVWTKDQWQEFGILQTEIVTYDVYVNYPAGHRLALLEKEKKNTRDAGIETNWKVTYEASLEEDVLDEDPTTGLDNRIPTFHGYSASGNVTAPYVYCNYGTYKDFEELVHANVSLKGKIALVKYGWIFRGLKVKRAQDLGMVGIVMYSDPGDDGEVTEENGNQTYPAGPAREPSAVQRGSTQYISIAPGDPTTPGYPSKPGVPRQPVNGSIPSIPSLPISYLDALPLLKALNGHGPKASSFNKYWEGGGLGHKGVEYNIGPSPDDVVLNLVNEQDYVTTPMWDVIGIINGTLSDEVVILGNHRDAWISGGAGDPNSGSATLNEVIRSFGAALAKGWKPLRTIVFASWDGEEYGLIGSTEWVEEYLPWLSGSAVAYLNVDVATTGPYFKASAAPLLNQALIETTKLVISPNQTVPGQTVYDMWNKRIRTMGSGSDFTAFQDYAGIPSLDMGFSGGKDTPVYHYHSNYDSFAWMENFGDPGFHHHVTMARIWALLAARLIEKPIISFNATDYAIALAGYIDKIDAMLGNSSIMAEDRASPFFLSSSSASETSAFSTHIDLSNLTSLLHTLHNVSSTHDALAAALAAEIEANPIPWWKWWERVKLYYKIRAVNSKYKFLERHFLYEKGLDGRPWFKHTVFAPGRWTGYSGATFPGLVEGVEDRDWKAVRRWVRVVEGCLGRAIEGLRG